MLSLAFWDPGSDTFLVVMCILYLPFEPNVSHNLTALKNYHRIHGTGIFTYVYHRFVPIM